MPLVVFYFQLHQPFRLHPHSDKFLWDEQNEAVFRKVATKCYLPALELFGEAISQWPSFKITLGLSGTFLAQSELYEPKVILRIKELLAAGQGNQVEILAETHYHSLVGLFSDPALTEFREQVRIQQEKLKDLFGVLPVSFRNTELMYNNRIARAAGEMGYRSILCEKRADMYVSQAEPISPHAVFRAKDSELLVIPRNRELSDDVAFRFPQTAITAKKYAASLAGIDGEVVLLGYDFEHIGEHIWEQKGIFTFWRDLPAALSEWEGLIPATPAELAEKFKDATCPIIDIHGLSTSSWADETRDTKGWLGSHTQLKLFLEIEALENKVRLAGENIREKWRLLTTSDHVYFLHEGTGPDQAVHSYFNPYGGSAAEAAHILTRKIDQLIQVIHNGNSMKKEKRTAIVIITPETGRLPEDMGGLAKYISGKSGGQGEVISALCEGLAARGVDVHLVTLNLKRRFQREAGLSDKQWREMRYQIDPANIHLVGSSVFAENLSAYEGDPLKTAAEFQKEIVNNLLKDIRGRHQGRLILHSHDWMAGGIITAYAKATGLPVLHTIHNVFTAQIPLNYYGGVSINALADHLYYTNYDGHIACDSQATAIKNSTLINFVSDGFLAEVVHDYFQDRDLVPPGVRREIKGKYDQEAAFAILNAPASHMYPERSAHLVRNFGPDDHVLEAKKANMIAFQQRTGLTVNPEAILFYWPSRLDYLQKGVELLLAVMTSFVEAHPEVQMAIIADTVGQDHALRDSLGAMAYSSGGRICYWPFSEALSVLGFAAANDVFGASLYEPCGQIDQIGNLFGATATNRDTGGYHDKIQELIIPSGQASGRGNGFLFKDYDAGGLRYGLEKSLAFHLSPPELRQREMTRIMREARAKYPLGKMVDQYLALYKKLNNRESLV